MMWLLRQRLRSFLRSSLWFYPLLSIGAAVLTAGAARWVDAWTGWTQPHVSEDGARAVVGTLSSALLTFIVFVFSVLLVAVQIASAQLTPRVIALVLRDPLTKAALAVFVFTYTYSLVILGRVEDPVPWLSTTLCVYSSMACVGVFLFLIDRVARQLRPVGVLTLVGAAARRVILHVYPRPLDGAAAAVPSVVTRVLRGPPRVVRSTAPSGVVLAYDPRGLVEAARRADCAVELAPEVGDFVATDDPLFRIYGGGQLDEGVLRRAVDLGAERTVAQDPLFGFRIIVDVASKALSPAINDPTTAVLAIDQLHHLLRLVGARRLDDGQVRDAKGEVRLTYRTPDWEDFVLLSVTEIRHFGAGSIQVARRLRAMLENLIQSLPEERAALLRQELALLQRTVQRMFSDPDDRARADAGDLQGVGGAYPEPSADRSAS